MDFKDGSQEWESFLVGPFLKHIRTCYNVRRDREGTAVAGFSDGGFGALRLGMKYPAKFRALAAFEPAIMPAFTWKHVRARNRFFISDALMKRLYGDHRHTRKPRPPFAPEGADLRE